MRVEHLTNIVCKDAFLEGGELESTFVIKG